MKVRAKHPPVEARHLTWEQAKAEFPESKPFKPSREFLQTGFYYDDDPPYGVLMDEGDFLPDGAWLLGPYPDGGYWLVDNLDDFEEILDG